MTEREIFIDDIKDRRLLKEVLRLARKARKDLHNYCLIEGRDKTWIVLETQFAELARKPKLLAFSTPHLTVIHEYRPKRTLEVRGIDTWASIWRNKLPD